MYVVSSTYHDANSITVTNTSKPFFDYFTPDSKVQVGQTYKQNSQQHKKVIDGVNGWR